MVTNEVKVKLTVLAFCLGFAALCFVSTGIYLFLEFGTPLCNMFGAGFIGAGAGDFIAALFISTFSMALPAGISRRSESMEGEILREENKEQTLPS